MIDEYLRRWLIKAEEDFKVAQHELSFPEDEMATSAICFHCQQLIEKLLKAYLISKNVEIRKTHDLELLLEVCSDQDSDFAKLDFGNLTSYAVEIRYADDFYIPSVDEAKECFEIASNAKDFILRKFGIQKDDL